MYDVRDEMRDVAAAQQAVPVLTVVRLYELQCAHRLTAGVPANHRCRRSHGHRYLVRLAVSGAVDPATGMVLEYGTIDRIFVPAVVTPIDHHDLNTLTERYTGPRAEAVAANPTVENLALWLWDACRSLAASARAGRGLRLEWIEIEEDSRSSVRIARPC